MNFFLEKKTNKFKPFIFTSILSLIIFHIYYCSTNKGAQGAQNRVKVNFDHFSAQHLRHWVWTYIFFPSGAFGTWGPGIPKTGPLSRFPKLKRSLTPSQKVGMVVRLVGVRGGGACLNSIQSSLTWKGVCIWKGTKLTVKSTQISGLNYNCPLIFE